MSDIFGKLKTGAGKVAFEADKQVRVKKEELDISQLKKQIDGLYTQLGNATFQSFVSSGALSPDTAGICQQITDLMQKIAVNEEDIRRINAETFAAPQPAPAPSQPPAYTPSYAPPIQQAPPPPPPPQTYSAPPPPPPAAGPGKFCTNCGRPNSENSKFCAECGAKIG